MPRKKSTKKKKRKSLDEFLAHDTRAKPQPSGHPKEGERVRRGYGVPRR